MIEAVIFDVDGVLLDSFDANLKFFQNLMEKAGYPAPTREDFPSIFHFSMRDAIKVLAKSESDEEIQRIWEMGKGRDVEYPLDLLKMPEGATETIMELNRTYPMGIVTSRIRSSIYEAPALARLKRYFKTAVAYEDTTNHKPHPEPLLLAAQQLDILPERAVYIGDVENDIVAGKAAGMRVIIYSKNKYDSADSNTSSFTMLPSIIKEL